mgnify:FL=1
MNDQKQWIPRVICLGLILGLLGLYQNNASVWAENQTANQAAVDAANAHNQEVLAEMAAREAGSASDAEEPLALGPYQDGSYTASAQGFGGDVTVTVTIEGGYIADITVDDASGEDAAYFSMAEGILEDIMAAQSAEVDTVSGATFSSTGLKNAVAAALEGAS